MDTTTELAAMVARACEQSPCSDDTASITAWRDAEGTVKLLVHQGSLTLCSHPPTTYVGPDGEVRLVQANQPFEKVLDGLTADTSFMFCP